MKMLFCIGLSALLLAGAAHAGEVTMAGKVTAVDVAAGTLDVSGVKVITKDAKFSDLLILPCSLKRIKPGWSVELYGKFTGPREFTARRIETKYFKHYEIDAKLDAADAQARTLTISGITVKVPADCEIEGENGKTTLIEKLPIGRDIEVEGNWTGTGEFTANKIEAQKAEEKKKEEHKEHH